MGQEEQMTKSTSTYYRAAGILLPAVLFAGCASQSEYDALKQQNQQLTSENQRMQQQVGRLQRAIEYTVNSDMLFAPGSWEMRERGKHIIADLAKKLAPTQQERIVVSGYTDNAPIGPALNHRGITSNQQLSEKRADTVMQYLISQGVRPDMVTARGLGEASPVASNDTAGGRAQNRRVVLSTAGA